MFTVSQRTLHRSIVCLFTTVTLLLVTTSNGLAQHTVKLSAKATSPDMQTDLYQPAPQRVLVEVFIDFYCPHCHDFEQTIIPKIRKEFGRAVEIREVGFPVVQGNTQLAFELHEAARAVGKGREMAAALFHILQEKRKNIHNPVVKAQILEEVGLNSKTLARFVQSGKARQKVQEGIARGTRYGITQTPVVVIDGSYLLFDTSTKTISDIIRHRLTETSHAEPSSAHRQSSGT